MEKDGFLQASAPEEPSENPPPYEYESNQQSYSSHSGNVYAVPPTFQSMSTVPSQAVQPTVIQVVSAPLPQFGTNPARIRCPYCHQEIITRVKRTINCNTHVCAMVMCLMCLWCCVCIPYTTDCLNDMEHECPSCDRFLGAYIRSQGRR